jgi:hypothetical protein
MAGDPCILLSRQFLGRCQLGRAEEQERCTDQERAGVLIDLTVGQVVRLCVGEALFEVGLDAVEAGVRMCVQTVPDLFERDGVRRELVVVRVLSPVRQQHEDLGEHTLPARHAVSRNGSELLYEYALLVDGAADRLP